MAAFSKLNGYVEHLAHAMHNFGTQQYRIALTNTAPSAESSPVDDLTANCFATNLTQINYTALGSATRNLVIDSATQTDGNLTVVAQSLDLSVSGTLPAFRYIYMYNTTNNALVGYWDNGAAINVTTGKTLSLDFSNANNIVISIT